MLLACGPPFEELEDVGCHLETWSSLPWSRRWGNRGWRGRAPSSGPRGALGVGLDLVPLTLTAGQAPPPGRVALLSPQPWWAADSEAPMGPVPYFWFVLSEQLQCRGRWVGPAPGPEAPLPLGDHLRVKIRCRAGVTHPLRLTLALVFLESCLYLKNLIFSSWVFFFALMFY